ncbi:ladderlectin-like [Melanotaenia boesemani]|uniref:ladderlectin-like n=1 Tax=Melanotaenia boesemani TaxID=1250792 RepID=UPI001C03F957|nr:ladderlectin-like [Melanotaenia boesemani]
MTLTLLLVAVMALTRAADAAKQTETGQKKDFLTEVNGLVRRAVCPNGWTLYNWRCFLFVQTPMAWSDAEVNCQSMKAHLASVRSAKEYQQIQKMIADQTNQNPLTWLGGSDSAMEGKWLWADGSRFLYTNWCQGEPNNIGNQDCLVMNFSGKNCWDDQQCNNQRPSVCVKNWSLRG